MALKSFTKDLDAVLPYSIDWAAAEADGGPWLASGETIVTSTWIVPPGITKDSDTNDDTTTTIWLSGGGPVGERHELVNRITDSVGRTEDRTIIIVMMER